jgi:uncharacterized protein (DUF2336 family)
MIAVPTLLDDLEKRLSGKPRSNREAILARVTDLFLVGSMHFTEQHIAVFDEVLVLLSKEIESGAKADLARRLAPMDNAPLRVINQLAREELKISRPILTHSPRVTEDTLLSVINESGPEHMLAVAERRNLGERITDVLIDKGDERVMETVAGNLTAKFSERGFERLIAECESNTTLQAALSGRKDIPPKHISILFELAKETARKRLSGAVTGAALHHLDSAIERSASEVERATQSLTRNYGTAVAEIEALHARQPLTESQLADFARSNRVEETICALARIAKLPLSVAERVFTGPENDLALIVSRSVNLSWPTVRLMMSLRVPGKPSPNLLEQLQTSYDKLTPVTAQRVLRFILARDAATSPARGP